MSIIDSNARFEDEDKAMQAILNDTQTVDVEAITEPSEAILAYNELEEAYHREIERSNMLQEALDAQQSQQDAPGAAQPTPEAQDTMNTIWAAKNASEALLALKGGVRNPQTVTAVLCAMMAEVAGEVYNWRYAADCVCNIKDVPYDQYRNDGHALRFILDAIHEKMERDLGPKEMTHTTNVPGVGSVTLDVRRIGPREYTVDNATIRRTDEA